MKFMATIPIPHTYFIILFFLCHIASNIIKESRNSKGEREREIKRLTLCRIEIYK
jgi:hypothetical protein